MPNSGGGSGDWFGSVTGALASVSSQATAMVKDTGLIEKAGGAIGGISASLSDPNAGEKLRAAAGKATSTAGSWWKAADSLIAQAVAEPEQEGGLFFPRTNDTIQSGNEAISGQGFGGGSTSPAPAGGRGGGKAKPKSKKDGADDWDDWSDEDKGDDDDGGGGGGGDGGSGGAGEAEWEPAPAAAAAPPEPVSVTVKKPAAKEKKDAWDDWGSDGSDDDGGAPAAKPKPAAAPRAPSPALSAGGGGKSPRSPPASRPALARAKSPSPAAAKPSLAVPSGKKSPAASVWDDWADDAVKPKTPGGSSPARPQAAKASKPASPASRGDPNGECVGVGDRGCLHAMPGSSAGGVTPPAAPHPTRPALHPPAHPPRLTTNLPTHPPPTAGSEALMGETDEEYVVRQTRLKEEAKARMAAKFGAGKAMGGVGSPGGNMGGGGGAKSSWW